MIIAGAGGAAHLPGMLAAKTHAPGHRRPDADKALDGVDSLLSIVQMPRGIPVATVAIGNGENAALLAVEILALADPELGARLRVARRPDADRHGGSDERDAPVSADVDDPRATGPRLWTTADPRTEPAGALDGSMDDERWERACPCSIARGLACPIPDRIPETAPTPLQRQYINLSAIALVAGAHRDHRDRTRASRCRARW